MGGIYGLSLVVLLFVRIPAPTTAPAHAHGRPLAEIARQPAFIVALAAGALGVGVMALVMTATPLAMHQHAHAFADTAFVIEWHLLGMFAPSFFTGHLIRRFGVLNMMLAGVALNIGCVAVNLAGTEVAHFWAALTLLGVGWNFLFIGGTTLLTETYTEAEKAKAQALNDFVVFTVITASSLSAGALQYQLGWRAVNLGVVPFIIVILGALLWFKRRCRVPPRNQCRQQPTRAFDAGQSGAAADAEQSVSLNHKAEAGYGGDAKCGGGGFDRCSGVGGRGQSGRRGLARRAREAGEGKTGWRPGNGDAGDVGAGPVSSGVALPPIPPVTGNRKNPVPSWGKPLPYPVIIADRRNNRLIEVTPDKRIVWELPSPDMVLYRGNEDVSFSPDGKLLAVSEEDNYDIHIVDYEKRAVVWTYGVPDHKGYTAPYLNYPDDAHILEDGNFLTADIRNCRVLIIDPGPIRS